MKGNITFRIGGNFDFGGKRRKKTWIDYAGVLLRVLLALGRLAVLLKSIGL
ncbi:MAG TPA: hypothetical protein VGM02_01615 [Acidobacteriaceae bacterium]